MVYLCRTCEPSAAAPELTQLVLLSLLSQLSTYITSDFVPGTPDSAAVLAWIAEASESVDPSDTQFAAAARSILEGLRAGLTTLLQDRSHADYNAVRTAAMAVHVAMRS